MFLKLYFVNLVGNCIRDIVIFVWKRKKFESRNFVILKGIL